MPNYDFTCAHLSTRVWMMLCSVNCVCSLLSCNVTGYCENENVCTFYWNSNNILSYVDISDENPGPPRCDDVIRSANNHSFYFCWMGPNDMSVGWISGYRIFLSVGDNPRETLSTVVTFHNDTWRTASTKIKKSASVCMLCSYRRNSSYSVNAYVWSLPATTGNDANACSVTMELNSPSLDKASFTNGTIPSHRKSGYFAVVSVAILVVGSGTLGLIAFIITKKRKSDMSSGFSSYLNEDEFQQRKRHDLDEHLMDYVTSGSNDDLISAVTLGSGNLPAPINDCVSENKMTSKIEEQEHLVSSEHWNGKNLKSHTYCERRPRDTSF